MFLFISEADSVDVDYTKFKELMKNENCSATVVPVLITLAGLPCSDDLQTNVLKGVFTACTSNSLNASSFLKNLEIKNSGVGLHEFVTCPNKNGQLEYHYTVRDSCYTYAAFAASTYRSRLFKEVVTFSEPNDRQSDIFESPLLNKVLKKFYSSLKTNVPFGKAFDKQLPNGFAYINVWDIRLSKTVFHFLPFLNGQLTNNYLWLFFHDTQNPTSFDLPAKIPSNHRDFERLMLWKPSLYYLMRNVYLTRKMKKTKEKPQCTIILASDKHVTDEESQQCMKKIMEKAEEMKMKHLIDQKNVCHLQNSSQTCSNKLKKIQDSIINSGIHSKAKKLPFSWICLRNAFYENSMLYVTKEDMQTVANELSIDGSRFDDFLDYFASFGSIIDVSKFGDDSPYIITNPVLFFQKLDVFLYQANGEIFRKYGVISREKIVEMFSNEADFFIKILLSVNLAFQLPSIQLSAANLSYSEDQSVYYIPVASQEKCNRECTHSALHLHITEGQVLCRNLQVKFAQAFLKENAASAKMLIREDKCFANVTSITYAGLSFDVVCHGNEAEFIVNDAQHPELYEAIINTLYAILKDLAASEQFFSFKFSFLCCKSTTHVSEPRYKLNQTCHFLPFTNDCKECEKFMSRCHSLKIWNTVLQQVL